MTESAVIGKQLQLLLWGAGNLPCAECPESLKTAFASCTLALAFVLSSTNALKKKNPDNSNKKQTTTDCGRSKIVGWISLKPWVSRFILFKGKYNTTFRQRKREKCCFGTPYGTTGQEDTQQVLPTFSLACWMPGLAYRAWSKGLGSQWFPLGFECIPAADM